LRLAEGHHHCRVATGCLYGFFSFQQIVFFSAFGVHMAIL
jgi:hypothetical protein